ncbi:MAG: hypothetical protein GY811_28335 [Myxococcales bacterium]|nr:hypothetical protein [Myxococcales bacterium]
MREQPSTSTAANSETSSRPRRDLVETVRTFADDYDDTLVEEFGGMLGKRSW